METRTYTERSNARRAARAAGLDPDLSVIPTDEGFEVAFPGRRNAAAPEREQTITDDTWPRRDDGSRKAIGEMTHDQQVAVARGAVARLTPEFASQGIAIKFGGELCGYPNCKCIVQTSTSQPDPECPKNLPRQPGTNGQNAHALDGVPDFLKIPADQRKAAWDANPPRASAAKPKEMITMPKTTKKPKKERGNGGDKNATLLKMLKDGSTVDQLTKALDWLPHTLRARISRLNKPKSKGGEGLKIERSRSDKITTYRIAS